MAARRRTCPRRPYGTTAHSNSNLPSTVPIIGFGCSSFSNFYESNSKSHDGGEDEGGRTEMVDRDTITPDMPVVKGWVDAIKHAVLDCGITLFDTAPWYGHGTSEIVIGYAMKEILLSKDDMNRNKDGQDDDEPNSRNNVPTRADLTINTKIGRYDSNPVDMFDFSYDRTVSSIRLSIERMQCGYIDVVQLHDPEFAPSIDLLLEETIPAMVKCREEGLVRAIGITGYPLEIQREILARSIESGKSGGGAVVFDQSLTYCHCNLHDMSLFHPFVEASKDEKEDDGRAASFADWCDSRSIALMAAAPLSMGLLTQPGPPSWHPASGSLKAACRDAASLCASREYNVDIANLAILYSLAQVRVSCTLLGMKSVEEVDRAMEVAMRFEGTAAEKTSENLISKVLTKEERKALTMLRDEKNGPFAGVWASEEYHWDGCAEANEFWEQISGGKVAAERAMKIQKG